MNVIPKPESSTVVTARRKYEGLPDYGARESWLNESLDDAEIMCKGDRAMQGQFNKKRLEMPATSFLKYLDQIVYRGF